MNNYRMTENGLVAKFQQPCGCNAEGPKCEHGKELYAAMLSDSEKLYAGKINLVQADSSLGKWQDHLGA